MSFLEERMRMLGREDWWCDGWVGVIECEDENGDLYVEDLYVE